MLRVGVVVKVICETYSGMFLRFHFLICRSAAFFQSICNKKNGLSQEIRFEIKASSPECFRVRNKSF
jgi:hypothetical protein